MDDPKYETELIEEYDGLNDNFAYFVLVANLEMLMRGHSIKIITQERRVNIDVPSLYSLTVNLPLPFDKEDAKAYFDCTKRTLALILPLEGLKRKEETPELVTEIKETTSTPHVKEISEDLTSDEMLFDLV